MSTTVGAHAPPAPPVAAPGQTADPVLSIRGGAVAYGDRVLWSGLDLDVAPGEFLAVLGANGAGKSTLLKAVLGELALTQGELTVAGRPAGPRIGPRIGRGVGRGVGRGAGRGSDVVGYVPQQRSMEAATPLRARDLVRLGIDGHRWGPRGPASARRARVRVDEALAAVGATSYADAPLGLLSGGEQQRVRIAQALATDPQLLLCDEPLLSLDLHHQRAVATMIDRRRREAGTAVVFVTHEINPVLDVVDRVLYIARGEHRLGTPAEVMTSESLSDLYRTPVEVLTVRGRLIVVGTPDDAAPHHCGTSDAHDAHDAWSVR